MQNEKPETKIQNEKVETKNVPEKNPMLGKTYLQIKDMGFEAISKLSDRKFSNPKTIVDFAKEFLPIAINAHNAAKSVKRTRDMATLESASRGIVNELLRLIKGYDKLSLSSVDKTDDAFVLTREK